MKNWLKQRTVGWSLRNNTWNYTKELHGQRICLLSRASSFIIRKLLPNFPEPHNLYHDSCQQNICSCPCCFQMYICFDWQDRSHPSFWGDLKMEFEAFYSFLDKKAFWKVIERVSSVNSLNLPSKNICSWALEMWLMFLRNQISYFI